MRESFDEGKISESRFWSAGVGGGAAVVGLNLVTGRVGGSLIAGASSAAGRVAVAVAVAAVVGASSGAVSDVATQGEHIGAGIQDTYDPMQTVTSAALGGAIGAASVPFASAIKTSLDRRSVERALVRELQTTEPVLAAKTSNAGAAPIREAVSDATLTLIADPPTLKLTGQRQSLANTAKAEPSVSSPVGEPVPEASGFVGR